MENYNITSVHQITKDSGISFDTTIYSCFKFGDKRAAKKIATELFSVFCTLIENGTINMSDSIVVASSAYLYTPAASALIKEEFIKQVNELLVSNNGSPVQEVRIYRSKVYSQDYGKLTEDERRKLVEDEDFYIDDNFIDKSSLIVIDDIRVTGLHEKMIVSAIEAGEFLPESTNFLYYASVEDENIPPEIEHALNFSFVRSLDDLKIIMDGSFQLTMRSLKMILGSKEDDLVPFLSVLETHQVEEIYHAAIGNSLSTIPEYKQSFELLKTRLWA